MYRCSIVVVPAFSHLCWSNVANGQGGPFVSDSADTANSEIFRSGIFKQAALNIVFIQWAGLTPATHLKHRELDLSLGVSGMRIAVH